MIGILFATLEEARPFLEIAAARPGPKGGFPLFRATPPGAGAPPLRIGILGMGPDAALRSALAFLAGCPLSRVVNAGVCGALRGDATFGPGSVFAATWASRTDRDGSPRGGRRLDPGPWAHLSSARLATADRPVFGGELRAALSGWADLVDMEGAAVAEAAERFGVPCTLLKGVSDHAGDGDRTALHRNLGRVSTRIAHRLTEGVGGFAPARETEERTA